VATLEQRLVIAWPRRLLDSEVVVLEHAEELDFAGDHACNGRVARSSHQRVVDVEQLDLGLAQTGAHSHRHQHFASVYRVVTAMAGDDVTERVPEAHEVDHLRERVVYTG
jgi:hypothetical protein